MLSDVGDLRQFRTARLELCAVTPSDIDVIYALNSDPRVWTHLPSHVHTSRSQTAAQVARIAAAWESDGLSYWAARLADATFAGIGGCSITANVAWNIYYRFRPEAQGRGLATELAGAARAAAAAVRPDLPVTALILEHNLPSKAVAEKSGLRLAWRGPDPGNPDPAATRVIYTDRPLTPEVLQELLSAH